MLKKHPVLLSTALMAVAYGNAAAARFEPPAGKILLMVGQSQEDVRDYVSAAHVVPGGVMSYTSIERVQGLDAPWNEGDGTQFAQNLVEDYPDTVLQIGLWMVDDCAGVARGDLDTNVDRLGAWIQSTRRPVFLRVGYEFDGPHNHYPPQDYIQAYRHIVDRFHKQGVRNVAYVWHSYANNTSHPLEAWYPGDDYVDWFGITYFNQPQSFMQPMVNLAKAHGKPVMIAEGSPMGMANGTSWNRWFAPLFNFMQQNDIKGLSYIGCDWNATQQFKTQGWGDTRLQSNPELLKQWLKQTSQERYLKASSDLFRLLGYDPTKP